MNEKQARLNQMKNEKALWRRCRIRLPKPDKCPDAEILAAYLDHSLSEEENSCIEEHFVQCQTCLDTILFLRKIDNAFYMPVEKKDLLAAENLVKSRFFPTHKLKNRLSKWFFPFPVHPILASTLLGLVCLTGFYLGNHTGNDQIFARNALAVECQFGLIPPLAVSDTIGEEGS